MHIDAEVESLAPACFSGCPQGTANRSAPCYLRCFENVTLSAPKSTLETPWAAAFSGGCPEVPH